MCIGAAAVSQLPTPAGMVMQQVAPTPVMQASKAVENTVDKKGKLANLRRGMATAIKNPLQGSLNGF